MNKEQRLTIMAALICMVGALAPRSAPAAAIEDELMPGSCGTWESECMDGCPNGIGCVNIGGCTLLDSQCRMGAFECSWDQDERDDFLECSYNQN